MSDGADFDITGKSSNEIEEEIEHYLWLKGFCILDMKLEASLDEALDDVKDLRRTERFEVPPEPIIEGILGREGTGEIAWLTAPDGEEESVNIQKLEALNQDLFYIADCTRPFFQSMGLHGMSVSDTLVVQGGEAVEDAAMDLTEASCSKWISNFLSAKLMLIYFMGPGDGLLELQPLDEDSDALVIKTRPDMLVILRSDVVARKHASTSSDYALCTWVLVPSITGSRGWDALSTDVADRIPGVLELNEWAESRLEELAQLDAQHLLDDSVPRAWKRMLRTKYFRNSNLPVAIRGMATHGPGTQDCEVLWKTLNCGIDYVGNVPLQRWDHAEYYDPDPQCYIHSHAFVGGICKTSVNHAQFIEGIELFDNKFFQISVSESGGMEPQQRHILETSYEALFMSGYNKKALMGSYIAVFTGCTNPEAMYINYTQGAGAGNVSQAITSNRTSFVLGIMGPSTSIDCEMASSHMALLVGCSAVAPNHEWRQKTGGHSDASITGGVYLTVTPYLWPRYNAYMNPIGRCFTFDQSANGYVRGESCTSLCQKQYMDKVDGEWVVSDDPCLGTMVGWQMTNNGRNASLTAPHAAAMQEVVHNSVNEAGIDALDMDAVECHGSGGMLEDSVEVSALARLLRHDETGDAEPLVLGAVKTSVSAQSESSGMSSFLKVMLNIQYAVNAPSLHLKQLNPHMEMGRDSLFMTNEHMPYRQQYVFHGCSSRSFNGTNTHLVQWYMADANKIRTDRVMLAPEEQIAFWPAGGGILDRDARPSEGFHIVGSWGWETPIEMEKDGENGYVYTVTLGANRFESFQIWMDGSDERVLHPRVAKAPSGMAVSGPSELSEAMGLAWMIDGRTAEYPALLPEADSATPQLKDAEAAEKKDVIQVSGRDRGAPGDRYEVRLSIAGKYRAVSWKKVGSADAGLPPSLEILGSYSVLSSYSGWQPEPMEATLEGNAGLYTMTLGPLPSHTGGRVEFQIVRNDDPEQTFHPPFGTIASEEWDEYEVDGPDEGIGGKTWCIKGKAGDSFKIDFQRSLESGVDSRKISWRRI